MYTVNIFYFILCSYKFTPAVFFVIQKYDRTTLSSKMDLIFNRLVARCYKELQNYAFVRPLEGDARTKHGDYVCLSVLEACEEILKSDPYLFDKKSPRAIAVVNAEFLF